MTIWCFLHGNQLSPETNRSWPRPEPAKQHFYHTLPIQANHKAIPHSRGWSIGFGHWWMEWHVHAKELGNNHGHLRRPPTTSYHLPPTLLSCASLKGLMYLLIGLRNVHRVPKRSSTKSNSPPEMLFAVLFCQSSHATASVLRRSIVTLTPLSSLSCCCQCKSKCRTPN